MNDVGRARPQSISGTTHNGTAATYTANALNQYSQRTVPAFFDVAGAAGTGTTVTVSSTGGPTDTATRHGQYFFDPYGLNNAANAVFATLNVSDGTTSTPLPAYLEKTPQTLTYDDDGNLTSDGRWSYIYDGENRLIWIQASSSAVAAGHPNVAFHIFYDYLGRRVLKHPYAWDGITWQTAGAQERYLYNGWNLIARLDDMALTKNFFWGSDLSGTLQGLPASGAGAGGVGCLLMVQDGGNTYLPAYDALGNLHAMIKAADGSLAAAYEYDAFGNTLRASGSYAASNPFRFSTKFSDDETGLAYYGLRYYSPTLGRFINKDPIEEKGGLNLYGFCGNNGVNGWDMLGQDPIMINGAASQYSSTANGTVYYDYGRVAYGEHRLPFEGQYPSANSASGGLLFYDPLNVSDNAGGTMGDHYFTLVTTNSGSSGAPSSSAGPISPNASREKVIIHPFEVLATDVKVPAPNSAGTSFVGALLNQGSSFGNRLTNMISDAASAAARWGIDVFATTPEIAADFAGHSFDGRWSPLSTASTTPRPTTLGVFDTQVLISTGHSATFGIPGGIYSLATGNYQAAQDYFGGGALTLISADLAGVRSQNLNFAPSPSQANALRFAAAMGWDAFDDSFGMRMPTTPTLQNVPTLPEPPPAIIYTMDPKPPAGAGPNPGR